MAVHSAHIHIVTDSDVTKRGIECRRNTGENADMWRTLWNTIDSKDIQIRVDWDKSHLDTTPHTQTFPPQWIYGNACTDILADEAADAATVPELQANTILKWYELLPQVQTRLMIIMQYIIDHEVITQGPRMRDVDITGDQHHAEIHRQHSIIHDEEGVYCSSCSQRPGDLSISDWLNTRCTWSPPHRFTDARSC